MRFSARAATLFVFATIAICAPAAHAGDFFNLTASGTSTTVSTNGSNLFNLTDNLINEQGPYASLAGQNVNGSLRFGPQSGAILFSENAIGTSATLTIPSTGFTKTFTGANPSDLQSQIHDFLKHDGQNAYSQFIAELDKTSPVAVVDGNPQASTAVIATGAFNIFGLSSEVSSTTGGGGALRFEANGAELRAGGINGDLAGVDFGFDIPFSRVVGLTFNTVYQSSFIGGASTYTVGEILGLPIKLIPSSTQGLSWELTPWGFGGLSASYDEASGTILVGGGGTSSLAWRMGPLTFTLADQISYAADAGVTVDDYNFDVPVNQWILKNGGRVAFNPANGPLFLDAGVTYTNFLRDAAVPNYWTPSAGVGFNFGRYSSLRLSYEGDFGHSYHVNGAAINLIIAY
jgi:hypothetical protein